MIHKIEVDLNILPTQYRRFVDSVIDTAHQNNVDLHLSKEQTVTFGNAHCAGFFGDAPPKFAVACGKELERWFQVFIHESCHMDQWLQKSPYWEKAKVNETESITILQLWIDEIVELKEDKLWELVRSARNVELDCERRVIEKIKKFNLPIDTIEYAKKANSYVVFYNAIGMYRQWYTVGREPYNIPEVYDKMPGFLYDDEWYEPQNISKQVLEALRECV